METVLDRIIKQFKITLQNKKAKKVSVPLYQQIYRMLRNQYPMRKSP